jgi:hypothetical protein
VFRNQLSRPITTEVEHPLLRACSTSEAALSASLSDVTSLLGSESENSRALAEASGSPGSGRAADAGTDARAVPVKTVGLGRLGGQFRSPRCMYDSLDQ